MKTRVLKDKFQEKEIRPRKEFLKYLNLIEKDVEDIFKSSAGNYFKFWDFLKLKQQKFIFF